MNLDGLDPRYRAVLTTAESFLVSYPGNWSALELAPFGLQVPEERRYSATSLRSRDVVDGLHHLDAVAFGDQEMLMPRWCSSCDTGDTAGRGRGATSRAAPASPLAEPCPGSSAHGRFVWVGIVDAGLPSDGVSCARA